MGRESFGSRLGFLLLTAGCAIGVGNVWRFPYVVGNYGGGAFVLLYIVFVSIIGIPILAMELAIGRASRKSAVKAYQVLQKPKQKWHLQGYLALIGNCILMMFYTVITGWMIYYFFAFAGGKFEGADSQQISMVFNEMLAKPGIMGLCTILVVALGFSICSFGLQSGTERITKWMMSALVIVMILLIFRSFTLPNAMTGIKFYLVPDLKKMKEIGILETLSAAANQGFFTLSIGMGSMLIFGSYTDKKHSLLGESITITLMDTVTALFAGLIIFPACAAYGVEPDSGPSLIFLTLPNVFTEMPMGRLWGSMFFVFMWFAAFATLIAVFENILACCIDLWGWSRKKASLISGILIGIFSLPCVLGFNLWSGFQPLGAGSNILDLEDFLVSNLMLPLGSLIYLIFCVSRVGWGFDNFIEECNTGEGIKLPKWARGYLTYVLPLIVLLLFIQGLMPLFQL
ncbi:sodium-dependent transporter [Lachnospiraceae bacterium 54-53]